MLPETSIATKIIAAAVSIVVIIIGIEVFKPKRITDYPESYPMQNTFKVLWNFKRILDFVKNICY